MGKPVGATSRDRLYAVVPPLACLALAVALVLSGGRIVGGPLVPDQSGPEDFIVGDDPLASLMAEPSGSLQAEAPADGGGPDLPPSPNGLSVPGEPSPGAASRLVAPAAAMPPPLPGQELQREAPREPLGRLGLALPPSPPSDTPVPWEGKPLFRPVAVGSAVFEAGGHTIAIAGVESIPVDESCTDGDVSWSCGIRARAAFRMWLRGRALVCERPEGQLGSDIVLARCSLAGQDVGAWLVENGWAVALPGSPYAEAGEQARTARLGIYGAPPDTSSITEVPDAPLASAPAGQPVMIEGGVDPQPSLDPRMAFPPAPPPP